MPKQRNLGITFVKPRNRRGYIERGYWTKYFDGKSHTLSYGTYKDALKEYHNQISKSKSYPDLVYGLYFDINKNKWFKNGLPENKSFGSKTFDHAVEKYKKYLKSWAKKHKKLHLTLDESEGTLTWRKEIDKKTIVFGSGTYDEALSKYNEYLASNPEYQKNHLDLFLEKGQWCKVVSGKKMIFGNRTLCDAIKKYYKYMDKWVKSRKQQISQEKSKQLELSWSKSKGSRQWKKHIRDLEVVFPPMPYDEVLPKYHKWLESLPIENLEIKKTGLYGNKSRSFHEVIVKDILLLIGVPFKEEITGFMEGRERVDLVINSVPFEIFGVTKFSKNKEDIYGNKMDKKIRNIKNLKWVDWRKFFPMVVRPRTLELYAKKLDTEVFDMLGKNRSLLPYSIREELVKIQPILEKFGITLKESYLEAIEKMSDEQKENMLLELKKYRKNNELV